MLDLTYSSEATLALAYWRDREWKKWRVDVMAGPEKRPTFARTYYAGARDQAGALRAVRAHLVGLIPRTARLMARLATPSDLGCVPTIALERSVCPCPQGAPSRSRPTERLAAAHKPH